jgi:hypothetical protein
MLVRNILLALVMLGIMLTVSACTGTTSQSEPTGPSGKKAGMTSPGERNVGKIE